MTLYIQRKEFGTTYTIGAAHVADTEGRTWWAGASLELEVAANVKGDDAIPPGDYALSWAWSPKYKRETLRVEAVPDRAGILIHAANHESELRGCIALGVLSGSPQWRIVQSRVAVAAAEQLRPTLLVIR